MERYSASLEDLYFCKAGYTNMEGVSVEHPKAQTLELSGNGVGGTAQEVFDIQGKTSDSL